MAVVSSGQSFVLFAIFALIIQTSVQPSLSRPCSGIHDLGVHDDYALMSTYDANLNNALSLIFSNTGGSMGSYASSSGQDPYKIYVVGVCRGDLKRDDCRTCLHEARAALTTTCTKKDGAIQWNDRCSLRFSTNAISPADMLWHDSHSLSGVTASSPPKGKEKTRTAIIVVAPVVTLMLLVVSICIILRRQPKVHFQNTNKITNVESFQFDFGIIKAATNNFSDVNELGKGGFGTVYRGKLSNGQEIAVKRRSSNSTQGDGEFRNEVLLVAKLQHRNLVKLLGFCLEKNERLLVYEFMPNASLDHYIFDPLKSKTLDWEKRYKIICGIARGMLYLHEDSRFRIIHRDVKAANILLDATMNPKISDFGMARMFVMDQTQGNTNRIVGTFGYMAPEYAMFGEFSTKSDVFSFGVLILEILSGHKITSFCNNDKTEHLLSLAWRSWKHGTTSNLIDPTLIKGGPIAEMMRCIHIGLLCVQQTVVDRPNMALVVLMLNSNAMALPIPTEPECFFPSKIQLATSPQSNINCWGSTYGVSITELFPR